MMGDDRTAEDARAGANGAAGPAGATGVERAPGAGLPAAGSGGATRGLVVERVWTTPGVHPYDQVSWERRDVVMTNWRDGSVNFEQRGVEFPDFWSINASNIVTTKYFRGAVGMPGREWSLKQLIDRVVGAYRAAGEKHGYFASPTDAEIFAHELTHLLLHQMFSFNSPVWFNVGTPSPQQVSACLTYDSLVSTPAGLVPIGELVDADAVGAKVYDATGVTTVVATAANGVRDVLRLHTAAGYTLDVTGDHLVWKVDAGFVEAGTLRPGDRLEWHRRDSYGETEFDRQQAAEAALAGWLQSDGLVVEHDGAVTVEAMTVNPRERAWLAAALEVALPGAIRREDTVVTRGADVDCQRLRLSGPPVGSFVDRWGLRARRSLARAPRSLFTAPLPVVAAYLRSLFQAEGDVAVRGSSVSVVVDLPGAGLARDVQHLLLRFGVFAHLSAGEHGGSTVQLTDPGDRETFARQIGFVDDRKAAALDEIGTIGGASGPTRQVEITRVEPLGAHEVYDIQTESGEFLVTNLRVHNCFILSVDDDMDSILDWYREEGLIFKGGSGSGVNLSRIRSSRELLSSGGNASGPVSFMRGADASAGTIKSGGATRRAAKMVILDIDHPDIEEFVATKAREEDKIRALRDAGFDMDLGGADIHSVQYQNANNSVRVTDEFMRAVERGDSFDLLARLDGSVVETVDAKGLFRKIAQAAWECADPGLQYDDTINDWHTNPETGRITASNPCCFTGDTLVDTLDGPVALDQVVKNVNADDSVVVRAYDPETREFVERNVVAGWLAGHTDRLVEVNTRAGHRLRCTPEHRFLTVSGWVEAQDLTAGIGLVGPGSGDTVTAVHEMPLNEQVAVYDIEVEGVHNFVVTTVGCAGVVVHNSEYLSLDNSSCNLASLNLMKFLGNDGSFETEKFVKAVEFVITAMDISICFADFPTDKIGETTRAYRQLGIGYANLGALLMAVGLPYDSDDGRALAGAITSLMTGTSYRRSAELAGIVGPYDGYARNAEAHQRVMRKHAAANDEIRTRSPNATAVARAAGEQWRRGNELGATNGWRNAQASVLAPTGCLTGDTLITTDRGLARLNELGDPYGDRWQDLDLTVSTDDGPRPATKFFVNGEEPTRRIVTEAGYRIQGTLTHRVKVVDESTGAWQWKRMADIVPGDLVPLQMRTLVGEPRRVPLPVLDQAYYVGDHELVVPDEVTDDLAELVGYFMGDGSLHAKGIRLCVADTDLDVVDRLRVLSKGLFHLEPAVRQREGYQEVTLQSVRLARWWKAAGFGRGLPAAGHAGKGWKPRVPSAILESNSESVYAAFVRGLFEADGSVQDGVPSFVTCTPSFGDDVRVLLLTMGLASTTRQTQTGWGGQSQLIRLRNVDHALNYAELVGFMGRRKAEAIVWREQDGVAKRDRVALPRHVWDELVPKDHPYRSRVEQSLRKHGTVARQTARRLHEETMDARLGVALGYLFERVAANEDGGVQPTFDLSVPDNVTYVAGGMVSHNTISFMLDCDTTGIEPDLALVKFKKLVGGGSMQIVNQTVPRALANLGYQPEQVEAIVEHIAEHGHVVDAPGLRPEHYPVFDCALGERAISALGHIRMMAAAQPFLSGSVSKTVNMPETATVEDVEQVYFEGWRLGLKALAIYRDNCKVGQPLSSGKGEKKAAEPEKVVEYRPVRKRLPQKRPSQTVSFAVGDAEGYLTSSSYPDDGLGEIFLKFGKQGSTLAGVMDAFSIAVSVALQYGVPLEKYLEKFMNMRFEPAGMTDDPDIRMATSVMDYVARRLALDYLPYEKRAELGIFTAAERAAAVRAENGDDEGDVDLTALASSPVSERSAIEQPRPSAEVVLPAETQVGSSTELVEAVIGQTADAPLCLTCGTKMRRAGSCYVCEGCGSTSGCS
jgi:ribonucleoside-diphosphate reductase alpha chain